MANKFDPILGKLRQSDVISVLPTQEATIDDLYGIESEGSISIDEASGNGTMNLSDTISGIYYVVYQDDVELVGGFGVGSTLQIDCSAGAVAGSHSFVVKMRVGGLESAGSSAFLVDILPNAPTIDSVAGDTVSPATENDATPDVIVSGIEIGDLVTIYDGETDVGSGTAEDTTITITTDTLSEDEHTLTATITRASLESAASESFVYTYGLSFDATVGTEYTVDGIKYHKFLLADTGDSLVCTGTGNVSVLLIAGGGAGCAGGGGAGGVLYEDVYEASGSIEVTVGDGGDWISGSVNGESGEDSVFGTLTAVGGGGGAWNNGPDGVASNGGSGGGGNFTGAGTSTPGTGEVGQGNDGGDNAGQNGNGYPAGGGGGAGAVGGDATSGQAGAGGVGIDTYSDILDIVGEGVLSTTYWIGGGGGGGCYNGGAAGAGGLGGGGLGKVGGTAADSGVDNTGGGGGGCNGTGGSGGSGMVIIYYAV